MKDEHIINDYQNGKSLRQIAKEYHVSRNRISKILKENNIEIRYSNLTSKRYFCNENFFEKIDNEEKAYWLGFIYADGFITTKRKHGSQSLGITLSIKDIDHLEKFKKSINSTHKINTYLYHGFEKEGYPATKCSRILIPSQKIVNDLKKHGVVENKTKILIFPKIKNDLLNHFLRGYLDGDGSLFEDSRGTYGLSFNGTKEFLEGINTFLQTNQKISRDKTIYSIRYSGNLKVLKVCNVIYKDATIYMDRKYNKYVKLLNKYTEK